MPQHSDFTRTTSKDTGSDLQSGFSRFNWSGMWVEMPTLYAPTGNSTKRARQFCTNGLWNWPVHSPGKRISWLVAGLAWGVSFRESDTDKVPDCNIGCRPDTWHSARRIWLLYPWRPAMTQKWKVWSRAAKRPWWLISLNQAPSGQTPMRITTQNVESLTIKRLYGCTPYVQRVLDRAIYCNLKASAPTYHLSLLWSRIYTLTCQIKYEFILYLLTLLVNKEWQ